MNSRTLWPSPVASTDTVAADVAPVPPDIAPVCATDMDVVCGGPVSTEPVTVTLNSVKPDLTMVWAADQTIWLLPGYTFGSADGGMYTVIAVADEFIQQPVVEPATSEPVSHPDTIVPDTASVAATEPVVLGTAAGTNAPTP